MDLCDITPKRDYILSVCFLKFQVRVHVGFPQLNFFYSDVNAAFLNVKSLQLVEQDQEEEEEPACHELPSFL